MAMNNEGSVIKYPNSQIAEYNKKYVNNLESGFNDSFIFDNKSRMKSDGKETGYFCPRMFWDYVMGQ